MRSIELNLLSLCPVNCSYCPQGALRKATNKPSTITPTAMDRIIDNVSNGTGHRVRVWLAGFTEPTSHPQFRERLQQLLGHHQVKDVHLFTTGSGLSREDVEYLRHPGIKTRHFHVRPPGDYGSMPGYKGHVWDWLPTLSSIGARFTCVGTGITPEQAQSMKEICATHDIPLKIGTPITRSANVQVVEIGKYTLDVPCTCSRVKQDRRPVVMPNGDVYACCNDFGLELKLGNLLTQTWEDLDFESVHQLQSDPSSGALCFRDCHLAQPQK